MLYQKYKNRIFSFARFLSFVKRYKVIIISVLSSIVVSSGTLVGLSGSVTGDSGINSEFVFGETINFEANAFLTKAEYEFYDYATGQWSSQTPQVPGQYKVRGKAKSAFGNDRYGKEHTFIIKPKAVEFTVSENEIVYGESPTLQIKEDNSLVNTDEAQCASYEFSGLGTETVLVNPKKADIKIYRGGQDITSYYDISVVQKPITINKRTVQVTVDDASHVYDGSSFTSENYTVSGGNFIDGDQVNFSFSGSIVNVGTSEVSAQFVSAVNANGENVFNYYNVEITPGVLTVTQRPLNIVTESVVRTYSGSPLIYDDYQIDTQTPLVDGEEISYNKASITDVGWKYIKDFTDVLIVKDGVDVTENYKIEFPGSTFIQIEPYTIDITSSSGKKVYDGDALSVNSLDIKDGVVFDGENYLIEATGDVIFPAFGVSITNFSTVQNAFTVEIKKPSGENSYSNYTVNLHDGTLTIDKRAIALNTKSYSWTYRASAYKDEYNYSNSDLILVNGEDAYYDLVSGHALRTKTYTEITNVKEGEVVNELSFIVENGENDVSINYDIIILQKGTLTIEPAPISINTASQSWVFDGNEHSNSGITAVGLMSNHQISWNEDQSTLTTVFNVVYDGDQVISIDNIFDFVIKDGDGSDQASNYFVISDGYNYGKLTVTPRPINVTTASNSWVYSGRERQDATICYVEPESEDRGLLENKGYNAEYDKKGSTVVFDVTDGTDNVFNVIITLEGEDVTSNFALSVSYGTLIVTVRHVEIISNGSSKNVYNGEAYTAEGYTVICLESDGEPAISDCDLLSVTLTGSITDVGEEDNTFTYTLIRKQTELSASNNYSVKKTYGIIEVIPRPIKVLTGTKSLDFNGEFQWYTDDSTVIEGSLVLDHYVEFDGGDKTTLRNVKRGADYEVQGEINVYKVKVLSSEGDKTRNYDISYKHGTLTITPIDVTVTTATNSWIYDAVEHYDTSIASESGLLHGHIAEYDGGNYPTVTNALEVKNNEFKVIITSSYGNETDNYNIDYNYGTISVEKRKITVRAGSKEEVYSGEYLTCDTLSFEWTDPEKTVYGQTPNIETHKYVGNIEGERLFVGTTTNVLHSVSITCNNKDVSSNYEITCKNGTLTVLVRPISIKPTNKEKIYDGTPLISDNTYEILGSYGVAKGDVMTVVAPGEITKAGQIDYYVTSYEIKRDGVDVSFNYLVDDSEAGVLKVTKKPITVISDSYSRIYDGTPIIKHSLSGDVVLNGGIYRVVDTNEVLTPTFTGIQIEVEDVSENNYFTIEIIDKNGDDSKDNYIITLKYGTLKAIPRPITVTTGTKSFEFDGETHCYTDSSTVTVGSLVLDHEVVYDGGEKTTVRNVKRDGNKVVGEDNEYKVVITSSEGDKTHNYAITYDYGTLTVTPKSATVTTATNSWEYDGEEHYDTSLESYSGFLDGHIPSYNDGKKTIVKEVMFNSLGEITGTANIFEVKVTSDYGDETSNYDITYNNGTLTITACVITIKPVDLQKAYDGTPLKNESGAYEYVSGAILPSEYEITIETDGSFIGPGTVEYNITSCTITRNGNPVSDYIKVNFEPGTLTVYLKLTVNSDSAKKVYDGTELVDDGYTSEGVLVDGEYLKVTNFGTQTNAGSSDNYCTVEIVDEQGNVIEGAIEKYQLTVNYGKLTVTKRPIFYSSKSDSKEFDGTPLENRDMSFEPYGDGTGLLPSHEIGLFETTQITLPGTEENKITEFIVICGQEDVSENYNLFAKNIGILEVTGKLITITTEGAIKTYDGTPLTNPNYTVKGDLMDGHELVVEVKGSQTEVGWSNNFVAVDVIDSNGNSVFDLYGFKFEEGILRVMSENVLPDGDVPSGGSGGGNSADEITWYKVTSSKSGRLYLRMTSYGDYDGLGWTEGVSYNGNTSISPLGYAYLAMINGGSNLDTVTVKKAFTSAPFVTPYYGDSLSLGDVSDVIINNAQNEYTFNYVMMSDLSTLISTLSSMSLDGTSYSAEELEYRNYVYNTYLQLPEYTKNEMLKVIDKNNLDASNLSVISEVASLVQGTVTYSKTFSYEGDTAVYFFNGAETGICSHYATAATALFRALGIPARYVGGITSNVIADQEVIFKGELHAWVEVYIDGIGWIQVEVTGSSADGESGIPGGSGSGSGGSGSGSGDGNGDGTGGSGSGSGDGDGSGSGGSGSGSGGSGSGSGDGDGDGTGGSGSGDGDGSGSGGSGSGSGGSGSGSGGGGSGSGGSGNDDTPREYYVKPVDVIERFESVNKVVYAVQEVESSIENEIDCFAEFRKLGYSWDFEVEGQLVATQPNKDFETESRIVYFILYDSDGNVLFSTENDSSQNEVIIHLLPGKILITNKDVIELNLYTKEKVYSGATVSYNPDEYYFGKIPASIGKIEFNLSGSLLTPGTLLVEDIVNESTFKAYDVDGNLLTFGEDYLVKVSGTPLTITRRMITVSSSSVKFKYNGKEQTANSQSDAVISIGTLVSGHTMKVKITGSITDVGVKKNTIESITIYDSKGNNVTDCYEIKKMEGDLEVY